MRSNKKCHFLSNGHSKSSYDVIEYWQKMTSMENPPPAISDKDYEILFLLNWSHPAYLTLINNLGYDCMRTHERLSFITVTKYKVVALKQ